MASPKSATAQTVTLYGLCQLYLDWVEENRSPATYYQRQHYLKSFIGHVGKRMKAGELKGYHVTQWYEQLRKAPTKAEKQAAEKEGREANGKKVSTTTQSDAAGVVKRMLNWALDRGHIEHNPIADLKRPKRKRRDVCYNAAEWQAIVSHATGPLVDFLEFLSLTGCRPIEARTLEGRHIQGDQAVFEIEKSKGKFERRVIYLVEAAKAILGRLVAEHPKGPVFRNSKGNPWTKDALVCRMKRIRIKVSEELGYEVPAMAYGARHSYATNALQRGVDSTIVANLMGHRDTTMVARTYSHVDQNAAHLMNQARRIVERDE